MEAVHSRRLEMYSMSTYILLLQGVGEQLYFYTYVAL